MRASAAVITGLVVAAALFFQTASSVLTVKNPEMAVRLFAANGLALEQLSNRQFLDAIDDPTRLTQAAGDASSAATQAFAHLALAPKAHAILVLAEEDIARRATILDAASRLNRRDLFLQGLALEQFVSAKDYPQTLDTLDRMLRVHPEQQKSLFPILDQAFAEDAALAEFDRILDGGSIWHENFLNHALSNNALLPNLAQLRIARGKANREFDRELISRLGRIGRYDIASQVYRTVPDAGPDTGPNTPSSAGRATQGRMLGWADAYPPFDWRFAEDGDFRAQHVTAGTGIEVYARSGAGGIIAERIFTPPSDRFTVAIDHDLTVAAGDENARLQFRCAGADQPFYDMPFASRPARFDVSLSGASCDTYLLGLHVRAWSGKPAVRGTIRSLALSSGSP